MDFAARNDGEQVIMFVHFVCDPTMQDQGESLSTLKIRSECFVGGSPLWFLLGITMYLCGSALVVDRFVSISFAILICL